ncbi:MAG: 30S ribosomal protein S5 [Thermoplasmata archaeon]|nr:MAG: 30S ribosomal protein S5 [Thermoplasmata archaeon]RLF41197.1 MAG: 30S ribosomal protein S5 [Thermoplasmata archaeon]HDN51184.1 30S ribosomal protein S5 [Thermoplasmatales archaeon]
MNDEWVPKTRLGELVMKGEITSMSEALKSGLPLREVEIVDMLLPDLEDEVIDVNMVQRMTDSGRRTKFRIVVAVGNKNGFVGIGQAKGREVGISIRKGVEKAKLNIIEVNRGCGSWECGCGTPHTLPFKVDGKCGSVRITLKPAPRGVGLAVGNVAKTVLRLAGIEDVWGFTRGSTRTTINYAKAVYEALRNTSIHKMPDEAKKELKIVSGAVGT